MLAIDIQNDKATGHVKVSAGFVNMNERQMLVTEFVDNDHLAGLESLIIQMNTQDAEATFSVLVNMPLRTQDPKIYEKAHDMLNMQQVEFMTVVGTKDELPLKNSHRLKANISK